MNDQHYSPEIPNFVEKTSMTTSNLKKALIRKISEIEDKSFLEAIKTILDSKTASQTLHLSPEMVSEIMDSKKEIEKGLFIENDLLEEEMEAWLNQK